MSPQPSHRARLIEGALSCLERLPASRITARAIALEAGANLGSIVYHFGSKDALVTEAVIEGLDRWLEEVSENLARLSSLDPAVRLQSAAEAITTTRHRHSSLVRNLIAAIAKAQHQPRIRKRLAEGFAKTRPAVAALLQLGEDQAGRDAAGLLHSMYVGLMFQVSLDPMLEIDGRRMKNAQARLRGALPEAL
jgi:AcrR family transcriptional regulator